MKSVKVALLAGLMSLAGVVEAKDVYYVSGYFGKEGDDKAAFTVKDSSGNLTTYEQGDTVVINSQYCTLNPAQAWISDELPTDSSFKIRVEMDFTFHSGVANAVLMGVIVEVAENVTATFNKGNSKNEIKLGTVVFDGDGTIDLSGAKEISDPLKISAGMKFKLPDSYEGGIVITDPEHLNPADYPDYIISIDDDGVAHLIKKDNGVALVDGISYSTFADAFAAAKPDKTIQLTKWLTMNIPAGLKDSVQWQGTVTFSGTMPDGFSPANYGNDKSTVEFFGVSGGYLLDSGSFGGTLKITNCGDATGWILNNAYSSQNFVFGALTGNGDIKDSGGATQQYSFKDGSTFGGSISTIGKKFVFGSKTASSTATIVIDEGATANLAEGKTWSATNGIVINGRLTGAGTLGGATSLGASGVIDVAGGKTCTIATINSNQLSKTGEGALKISAWSKALQNLSVEGEIVNGVFKDSNNIMISGLTLTGDTRFAGLGFGFTGTANLGSHTLRIATKPQTTTDKSWYQNFSVKDATLDGTGAIVVEDGSKLLISTATQFANGTLEVLSGGACEKAGDFTVANVVLHNGGSFSGNGQVVVSGTLSGDGTVDKLTFANDATIDPSAGLPTVTSVTYGSSIIVKANPGDAVFKANAAPANTVTIKDADGKIQSLWSLKNENGTIRLSGDVKKLLVGESWTVDAATAADFPTPLVLDLSEYYGENKGQPIGETAHTVITLPVGMDASAYLSKIQVILPTLHKKGHLTAEGNVIKFAFDPLVLYWVDYRGTFWDSIYGGDKNGNNGLGRTEAGVSQAILAGDTVIFDKVHYQVAGVFQEQSPYWHYDENLYIKNTVNPGKNNEWDLKILEGVNLKLGFCGPTATGQNLNNNFKIYVEKDSTLELGYWGNTHHREGLLRKNLTFGGAGTITLGDDMGTSCRVEGDLKVKQQDPDAQTTVVPTLDVRGKELVVKGGQIDVNLTGFGALSGSGTITTPITFNNATITNSFTFTDQVTLKGVLTVQVAALPVEDGRVPILTASNVDLTQLNRVVLVKDGHVSPIAYTAELVDGVLYAKIDNRYSVSFNADHRLGYDFKTFIVVVELSESIEGVGVEVSITRPRPNGEESDSDDVTQRVWKGTTDSKGTARVMIGSPDELLDDGGYTWTATVDGLPQMHVTKTWSIESRPVAQVDSFAVYSMERAVAVAGESGTIKLLTNVFFAPPPGRYNIDRDGYDIMITNDMRWQDCNGGVEVAAPKTVDHYTVFKRSDPFVIEGEWLGHALPWMTQKKIQEALTTASEENGLKPYEAYVLGLPAATWETEEIIARGVETGDKDTIEVSDGLRTKPAAETGVVVTKTLVDAETKREVSATPIYDLLKMETKAKLLKLNYEFSADLGQEPDQGE